MNTPKRIAYITSSDPNDRHAWSGTNFYILKSLQSRYDRVDTFGPAEPILINWICKVVHGVSLLLTKKRFDYRHSKIYARAFGKLFGKRLQQHQYDLIVAPAGISYVAYLKTSVPIVLVCDRVIANTLNYHTIISNLWKWSEFQSLETESIAFHRASLNIFSSHWAADFATEHYQLNNNKVKVIPFGSNMDVLPTADFVFQNKVTSDVCRLLLIGTMWKNKGANIAVNALHNLLNKNIKAHLTIVGCEPEIPLDDNNVTVIPFINKNSESGLNQLEDLFLSHSFFILPTRFDCTPIVFCESSAYALPIICADTGGVKGHVKESVNGYCVPYEDMGIGYADIIYEIWRDQPRYKALCQSARKLYDTELNWQHWIDTLDKAVQTI
jgi:glycosyltransferase involved in cell wall biosynthesis